MPGSTATRDRIPPHLRQYAAEQDYGAYDEIDQAVWRFILLQTWARLQHTAHPAYARGLAQTGIDVERIPRISEMDRCLAAYGWGAVAVDGFIPPRAFQEFQALGILTIAGAIRTPEHLAYTPAPDIVHESAGHAPILPDPVYREYLRRFGAIGARAFSSPRDRHVYQAIHRLSELKEDPAAEASEIAEADADLVRAQQGGAGPSEATLLSRLHWWTVEYGLVGTPADYRLYGAGLLSSLGESHFCHDPAVAKLPLSAACVETDYDITKPQPQLFVAEDFEQLGDVLEEVAGGLAQERGGALALERALASEEVATLELDSGLAVTGVLTSVAGGSAEAAYLSLRGPCALSRGGHILDGHGPAAHPEGYGTPLGRLAEGEALARLGEADLARYAQPGRPRRLLLRYRSGVRVEGRLERALCDPEGRLLLLSLSDCTVERGGERLFDPSWGSYDLAAGESVRAARAGPADPAFWPESAFPSARVPSARERSGASRELLGLYREALRLWEQPRAPELVAGFEALAAELRRRFPDEWLLPWNLLECLRKLSRGDALASALRRDLLAIEARFPREAPISTGLRTLDERHPGA